jgi:hypothetical protein
VFFCVAERTVFCGREFTTLDGDVFFCVRKEPCGVFFDCICVVVARDFMFCMVGVRVTTRCSVDLDVLRVFLLVSVRFVSFVFARLFVFIVTFVRLFVTRVVLTLSANVVHDTDKPRHTVKNSIILFIPFDSY